MDGKHKLVIHDFEVISYRNKKTKEMDSFRLAQCEITSQIEINGVRTEKSIVGQLPMPRHLKDVVTGEYLAEFQLSRNRKCQIVGSLFALHKFGDASQKINVAPKRKVRVLDYVQDEFINFKGEPQVTTFAQCVMTSEVQTDAGIAEKSLVGKLRVPKHLLDTPKGLYYADFELAVDWSMEIGASLIALRDVTPRPSPRPPASAKGSPSQSA
jgi:hypothetical protein